MSATQKFFQFLFGVNGTRSAVPDAQQANGTVAYQTGYPVGYEKANTDPNYLPIERDKFNQLLYDVTLALQQYQTHGFPEYVQPADNGGNPWAYDKNAFVKWTDGNIYCSLVANNTTDPSNTANWVQFNPGSDVGKVSTFSGVNAPPNYVKANGALLSRTAYPQLWAYAQASGNIAASDAAWSSQGAYGAYSPGDGATTFRVPDLRGYHLRVFDDGRGVDAGRTVGSSQASQLLAHTHGVNDPTHNHTHTDPTHTHGVNDPTHVHAVTDPGHNHPLHDPGHSHGVERGNAAAGGNGFTVSADAGSSYQTAVSGTGIYHDAAVTGVSLQAHATGVTNAYAGTGVTNNAAATGISLQSTGGGENRVATIALPAFIRYQ